MCWLNASPYSIYGYACKVGYYNTTALINSGTCHIYYSECSTCNQAYKLITCKDSNAEAHTSVGCVCKSFYYNVTSLVSNGACLQCYQDCKTCTQNLLCTEWVASNSGIHSVVGCEFDTGFYNLTSLTVASAYLACFSECNKCSTQYVCTEYVDSNAEPKIAWEFWSPDLMRFIFLSTHACVKQNFSTLPNWLLMGIVRPALWNVNCIVRSIFSKCVDSNSNIKVTGGCLCKDVYYNVTQLTLDVSF